MVIGHRGGYIGGPENSMKCFRGALANNLDGIEFDVSKDNLPGILVISHFFHFFHNQIWLSKDNIPVIIHGGDNGELHQSINGSEDCHVFDVTYEELRTQVDIGDGETIPTLE